MQADLGAVMSYAAPFVAILSRLSGLFVFAPLLSGAILPTRLKVMLLLAMGGMAAPVVDHAPLTQAPLEMATLVPIIVAETSVGLVIGALMLLPIVGVQIAGVTIGQQLGITLADVIDPTLDAQADTIGQLFSFIAFGVYLAAGGIELALGGILQSFQNVPLGAMAVGGEEPLALFVGLLASGYELALRIAAPALCIVFVESVAMAFIMKTAPQMNVLSIGFPIRIMAGFSVLLASVIYIHEAIRPDVLGAIEAAVRWAASIRPAGG